MTQITALATKQQTLREYMFSGGVLAQIKRAVRTSVDPETISRLALSAANSDDKLWGCTPLSFAKAVVECCQLGLEPNSVSGEAYLVPFRDNRANAVLCTLIPGYKGLIKLAYNSGQVASVAARNVYEGEPFTLDWGADPPISHTELPPSERGDYKLSYARIKIKGGEPQWEVMWAEDMAKVQARAKSRTGPWSHKDDVKEMRRKTVLRKSLKWVPKSATMTRALALQDDVEAGRQQAFIDVVPESAGPPKPQLDDYTDPPAEPAPTPDGNGEKPEPYSPAEKPTDLAKLKKGIRRAYTLIPAENRPGVLKNLSLGKIDDIEGLDVKDLRSVFEQFDEAKGQ